MIHFLPIRYQSGRAGISRWHHILRKLWAVVLVASIGCTPPEEPVSTSAAPVVPETDQAIEPAARAHPLLTEANAQEYLAEYFLNNPSRKLALTTRLGTIKVRLFDDTPLHSANFLMLAERAYFDNTEFTRVVKGFVVQGGNNENEIEDIKRMLIGSYLIDAELHDKYLHRRGALAAARHYEDNPDKRSSPYNFYLVHGRTFNDAQLLAIEREHQMKIPAWKRKVYETEGGAPHLDGQHTVFGQVYEGLDVLDQMASIPVDKSDWPLEPLIMKVEVLRD